MSSVVSASLGPDGSGPVTSANAVEAAGWTTSISVGCAEGGSAEGSCDEDAARLGSDLGSALGFGLALVLGSGATSPEIVSGCCDRLRLALGLGSGATSPLLSPLDGGV